MGLAKWYCPVCGPVYDDRNGEFRGGLEYHIANAHNCWCEEEDRVFFLLHEHGRQWIMCRQCGAYYPIPSNIIAVDANV